jgi:hypothetical protein
MWFIFISAHRFFAGLLPIQPYDWPGTGWFRREPLNSTSETCTHVNTPFTGCCGLPVYSRTRPSYHLLFFSGARRHALQILDSHSIARR